MRAWSSACTGSTCAGIRGGFLNSLRITVPSVLLSTALGAIGGYTLSFWRFRGATAAFAILTFGMFVPFQVFIVPLIRINAALGLYGTLAGIILIHVTFGLPVTTLMFRNYFAAIPLDLFKAARVDGAGYIRVFAAIMLPLSRPMIVVAAMWQATATWNDYIFGLVFAGRRQPADDGAAPGAGALGHRRARVQRHHGRDAADRGRAAADLLRSPAGGSCAASPRAR